MPSHAPNVPGPGVDGAIATTSTPLPGTHSLAHLNASRSYHKQQGS